jgi:hypothetical protein
MFSFFKRRVRNVQKEDAVTQEQSEQGHEGITVNNNNKIRTVRYRQWLTDRVNGVPRPSEGKHDRPDPYPPSVLCLPTSIVLWCPYILEENCLCTLLGRLGCFRRAPWARNACMKYSLFLNILCLLTGLYVCLSISDSRFDILQISFMMESTLLSKPTEGFQENAYSTLGLSAMTLSNPNTGSEQVIPYTDFCDMVEANTTGLEEFLKSPPEETCQNCETVLPYMVIGLIVAVVCVIPSMLSQCTRLYEVSDTNFSKCWSILMELLSLAGFVLCWYQFYYGCFQSTFFEGEHGYTLEGQPTEPDSLSEAVRIDYVWRMGYAMICLYACFGLKLVCLICDCLLPTPIITRNTYEQKVYESKCLESDNPPGGSGGSPNAAELGEKDRDDSFSEDQDGDDNDNGSNLSYESLPYMDRS